MLTLTLAAFLAAPAAAAPARKAPEFKIAKVFNAPATEVKSLASLKGKVVFLEFWATWCAPCVAGVPRTNRLIDSLKGEPVVFLSVTDEPADMIAAFLKKHEFKSWVGVDEAKSSLKAYKVHGRPDGYLIGKDGTLLARVSPDRLQESQVRDAIAGRFKPLPVMFGDGEPSEGARPVEALFELTISSGSGEMSASKGGNDLEVRNLPFVTAIAWIWGVRDLQVIAEHPPVESFNARLKTTFEGFAEGIELLKQAIQSAFGVTVTPETKEADVLLLSLDAAPGASRPKAGDPALKSGIMASGGGRLLGKATMARFASALGDSETLVVDNTGLEGEYLLDLEWQRKDDRAHTDRARALAAQGLRLVPGRRKVEYLRVSPSKK